MRKKKLIAVFAMALTIAFTAACNMGVGEAVREISLTDPYISVQPASYSYFVGNTETPALKIEVYDWAADEGNLTYQWYTFKTIDDYVLNGLEGEEIPGASGTLVTDAATGEASAVYTPANLDSSQPGKFYYYAEITNNNSNVNIGDQTGRIRSDVAIISYSAANGALSPVISRHPGNAGYQAGRSVNSLTVRASSSRATDTRAVQLTYRWFILTVEEDETTGEKTITREPVTGIVQTPAFQPDPSELKFGKNYFYAEVISTETAGGTERTAVETSIPAIIEILPGVRAVAPVIEVQPKDKMYFIGETLQKLTVEGETRDNGQISYQWYSSTGPAISSSTVQEIAGETLEEFMPTISNASAGTQYYYAVVTNTNTFVTTDQTTAAATSKVAKISVASPAGTVSANATVVVANPKAPANRYQYIRGYGGMDVAWANFPEQKQEDMHTMYNPDRLGYNINRIMISPGKVNPSEGIQDLLNSHRPNYYENVKIVNSYGGYNLASPWSPPKEWKTNNSINGGGKLIEAYYRQFAEYLKSFAQDMYDHGAPIYAISISNEPNYTAGYDGCEWDDKDMAKFYAEMGRFTSGVRGFGGGRQISTVLTVNGESANTPVINIAALTNPVSRAAIDLYCRHVYGEQTTTLWRYGLNGSPLPGTAPRTSDTVNILDRGDGTKYEVWMTEHNINSANATAYPSDSTWNYVWRFMNDVDLVMRMNNENAFIWWASKRFYSMIGDNSYNTIEGAILPRGYGLSHYAKYTIDTHRLVTAITGTTADGAPLTVEGNGTNVNNNDWRNAGLDNESARITAYASIASGKDNAPINDSAGMADVEFISLVMWTPTGTNGRGGVNMGTVKIDMPDGFRIGSYTAIRSTGGGNLAHVPDTSITVNQARTSAYVTLPNSNMVSVKFIKE